MSLTFWCTNFWQLLYFSQLVLITVRFNNFLHYLNVVDVYSFLFIASARSDAAEAVVLHTYRLWSFSHHLEISQILLFLVFSYLKLNVWVICGSDSGWIQHTNFLQVLFVLLAFCVINVKDVVNKLFRVLHHLLVIFKFLRDSRVIIMLASKNVFRPSIFSFGFFVTAWSCVHCCSLTGLN